MKVEVPLGFLWICHQISIQETETGNWFLEDKIGEDFLFSLKCQKNVVAVFATVNPISVDSRSGVSMFTAMEQTVLL